MLIGKDAHPPHPARADGDPPGELLPPGVLGVKSRVEHHPHPHSLVFIHNKEPDNGQKGDGTARRHKDILPVDARHKQHGGEDHQKDQGRAVVPLEHHQQNGSRPMGHQSGQHLGVVDFVLHL